MPPGCRVASQCLCHPGCRACCSSPTDCQSPFRWTGWALYREVNRRFAELVARRYRPGDLIWVHDYQLCLVPRSLPDRGLEGGEALPRPARGGGRELIAGEPVSRRPTPTPSATRRGGRRGSSTATPRRPPRNQPAGLSSLRARPSTARSGRWRGSPHRR
ncbi:MAG: trehalose-6-phosphate synthase [Myxococcales bacterium]|nr:trehalose-6-phosphate synthase [Myxococcales bacterium]